MGMFLRRPSRQNSVEKCPASSRLNEENSPDTSASNARHRLSPPRQILQDRAFPSGSRAAQSGCNRSGQRASSSHNAMPGDAHPFTHQDQGTSRHGARAPFIPGGATNILQPCSHRSRSVKYRYYRYYTVSPQTASIQKQIGRNAIHIDLKSIPIIIRLQHI
jgi:hypothetical protein